MEALKPLKETHARFGLVESMWMPLTKRVGCNGVSTRVNTTLAAAPLAFFEMNTRPADVAAQSVDASAVVRSTAAT